MKDNFKKEHLIITKNEDLLFHWTIIIVAANWEEKEAAALLELVADLFVTIRGFVFVSSLPSKK